MAEMVRRSACRGSKSVDARTISSPTRQPDASRTWIEVLPALAVLASLVHVCLRSPCRFRVPPMSMIPRSTRSLATVAAGTPMSSPLTLSVSVMVALRVGPGFGADFQFTVHHDPLGGQLEVGRVGEAELAVNRQAVQCRRADVEGDGLARGDGDLVARTRHLSVRPGGRI